MLAPVVIGWQADSGTQSELAVHRGQQHRSVIRASFEKVPSVLVPSPDWRGHSGPVHASVPLSQRGRRVGQPVPMRDPSRRRYMVTWNDERSRRGLWHFWHHNQYEPFAA